MPNLPFLDAYSGETTNELLALEGKYRIDSLVLAFERAVDQKAAASSDESSGVPYYFWLLGLCRAEPAALYNCVVARLRPTIAFSVKRRTTGSESRRPVQTVNTRTLAQERLAPERISTGKIYPNSL